MKRAGKEAKLSRRELLKTAGASAAAASFGAVALNSKQLQAATFDSEYDIVVCGGGGAGLPVALFSRWLGNKVLILEKAATLGGTSFKAAYWYWVPNNAAMRKAGMEDSTRGSPPAWSYARRNCAKEANAIFPLVSGIMISSRILTSESSTR